MMRDMGTKWRPAVRRINSGSGCGAGCVEELCILNIAPGDALGLACSSTPPVTPPLDTILPLLLLGAADVGRLPAAARADSESGFVGETAAFVGWGRALIVRAGTLRGLCRGAPSTLFSSAPQAASNDQVAFPLASLV